MVLDFRDEVLSDSLNVVLSGLLPHENFSQDKFGLVYYALQSTLPLDSVRGIHYVMYYILGKYNEVSMLVGSDKFQVSLTRERFDSALANNLPDLILNPAVEISRLMEEEGKSADLNIPTVQQEIMGVVYDKCMSLYDTCFELCKGYEDALSGIVDLRTAIEVNMIETGLSVQRTIISTGMQYGRKFYRGVKGWLEFTQLLTRELTEAQSVGDSDLVCDSVEKLAQVDQIVTEVGEPLGEYGIPVIDDFTPILKHRFCVLVAKENVGKTRIVERIIASLIRKGVKCLFSCGESSKEVVEMEIVSSYIRQEYGMYFPAQCLVGEGFEQLSSEDKQIVSTAKARVITSGLAISTDLEYDNVTSKFRRYYEMGYEAFFIDHSQSLRGRRGRKMQDLVTSLAIDCRDFKREYPVYVMLTSQPSADLKELLQKDNTKDLQISPTAQSATPSQEADELFIVSETEYLKRQGLLQWFTYKRRQAEKPAPVYIKTEFNVSNYVYDPKYQSAQEITDTQMSGLVSHLGTDSIFDDPYADDVEDFEIKI